MPKNAMQLALYRLLDGDVSLLKGKRLDKDYFNTLLTGGDPIRDLLQWLDQGRVPGQVVARTNGKPLSRSASLNWPSTHRPEGVLAGSTKLANHEGPWHAV